MNTLVNILIAAGFVVGALFVFIGLTGLKNTIFFLIGERKVDRGETLSPWIEHSMAIIFKFGLGYNTGISIGCMLFGAALIGASTFGVILT